MQRVRTGLTLRLEASFPLVSLECLLERPPASMLILALKVSVIKFLSVFNCTTVKISQGNHLHRCTYSPLVQNIGSLKLFNPVLMCCARECTQITEQFPGVRGLVND